MDVAPVLTALDYAMLAIAGIGAASLLVFAALWMYAAVRRMIRGD